VCPMLSCPAAPRAPGQNPIAPSPPPPPPPQGAPARGACNCRGLLGSHPPQNGCDDGPDILARSFGLHAPPKTAVRAPLYLWRRDLPDPTPPESAVGGLCLPTPRSPSMCPGGPTEARHAWIAVPPLANWALSDVWTPRTLIKTTDQRAAAAAASANRRRAAHIQRA